MRALLDAHVFIWWVLDRPELSKRCRDILGDGRNEIMLSAASAYEIAYKAELGRLSLPEAPGSYIESRLIANAFAPLAIELRHALRAAGLPSIHRDPFDRILVAQAQLEALPILTTDQTIARYDVETIW
jgi:PIN domain nuclease of toxin-antitoxin system